jgi:GxxExxY protein
MRFDSLSSAVIGAYFSVYNELRPGYLEAVYANALGVELRRRRISYQRECPIEVRYRGEKVGIYRADLIVDGKLLVEVKAGRALDESARWQTLNYLRGTGLHVGLLLFFGPGAVFHRVVASDSRRSGPVATPLSTIPRIPPIP